MARLWNLVLVCWFDPKRMESIDNAYDKRINLWSLFLMVEPNIKLDPAWILALSDRENISILTTFDWLKNKIVLCSTAVYI